MAEGGKESVARGLFPSRSPPPPPRGVGNGSSLKIRGPAAPLHQVHDGFLYRSKLYFLEFLNHIPTM